MYEGNASRRAHLATLTRREINPLNPPRFLVRQQVAKQGDRPVMRGVDLRTRSIRNLFIGSDR
jgi:hypothetical protein